MLAFALVAALLVPTAITAAVDSTVLTPGGYLPAANVKAVPLGGGVARAGADVHIVDSVGTIVDKVTPKPTPTQPAEPFVTGWTAWAFWSNTGSSPINNFITEWTVPPAPATWNGQTLFYFNALTPTSEATILQPVLQYGSSAAGGGEYWSVASWYVTGDTSMFTPLVNVTVGQVLTGLIALTGQSGSNFNYETHFNGISGTTLLLTNSSVLTWASETLEAYGITTNSDYSTSTTVFSAANITVQSGTPSVTWNTTSDPADGVNIAVNNQGATNAKFTITYSG